MDPNTLRILFLVLLGAMLFFYSRRFKTPGVPFFMEWLSGTLFIITAIGTVLTFIFILTRSDPMPLLRQGAYYAGLQQLVDFGHAIPINLEDNLNVARVERIDTDDDGFQEWVVFYQFDKRAKNSPIYGAVYDNDRGNPPVIFPYLLRAPDREYLSDDGVIGPTLFLCDLDTTGCPQDDEPLGTFSREVFVWDPNNLTIFRYVPPSPTEGNYPTDSPARYQSIGFFRSSGTVDINPLTPNAPKDTQPGDVTVISQNGFERSQLVLRSVFRPSTESGLATYFNLPRLGSPAYDNAVMAANGVPRMDMVAPSISTVDFPNPPPAELFNTPFPEKIVLGFYVSTCAQGNGDASLCSAANLNTSWSKNPKDFLGGDALANQNVASFFSLPLALTGNTNIQVSQLVYYPGLETDPDLLPSGCGLDVYTGEKGQIGYVEIAFTVNGPPTRTARYLMGLNQQGQWKIMDRLDLLPDCSQPPKPPVAVGSANPNPQTASPGQAVDVHFSGEGSSDPDGDKDKLKFLWIFDDGTTAEGPNVPKQYTSPGHHSAKLLVTDTQGLTDTTTVTATIELRTDNPIANPNGPYEGTVCQEIEFSGNGSVDPDGGQITNYRWDFGDRVSESTQNVNIRHTYHNPGNYTVSLVVTDDEGQTNDPPATTTVNVYLPPPVPPPSPCGPPTCCW